MLNETHWSQTFVKNGYRVIIPSHLFYNHARKLYVEYPHHVVWTRFVSDVLDVATQISDLKEPIFATGVSSGCTTASILNVLRSEVSGFSGGGAHCR